MNTRLDYSEVLKLKAACAENFSDHVHFHDGCGGQFFSLDERNDSLREFICGYFDKLGIRADFTDSGLEFTLSQK